MEQAAFQQVCNNYLLKIYGGTLESPGTMDGKTKTKKGKPDTYLVHEDGSYIIAEITTHDNIDKAGFSKKLKSDRFILKYFNVSWHGADKARGGCD